MNQFNINKKNIIFIKLFILFIIILLIVGLLLHKNVPEPRRHHTSVHIGDKDYIFGGYTGSKQLNDLWEYDRKYNKWKKKSDSPLEGRSGHVAVSFNDKMYVFGGVTSTSTASNEFMEYNPATDIWTVLYNVPNEFAPRSHCSGAISGNKWYIFAGHSSKAGAENDYNDLWVYDFSKSTFSQKASNIYRRSAHTSIFFYGKMYSFGGDSDQKNNAPISIYDPIANSWQEKTSPWGYIHKATAVVYGNNIYIYGGNNPLNTNHLREYSTSDNTYTIKSEGLEGVNAHTSLIDGSKMRVFGGNNIVLTNNIRYNISLNKHYEYDFETDKWIEIR